MASPKENCKKIFLGQEKLVKFFSGFELWIKPNCNSANIANATAHYARKSSWIFCAKKIPRNFLWKCGVLNPALHNKQNSLNPCYPELCMKVTKYPQSCFVIESSRKNVMIDYGGFMGTDFPPEKFFGVSA